MDESRGAGGGRSYWKLWRHKSWPHHVSLSNKSLVCGPCLRVRESRTERKSGKNAALLCMVLRLKWVPSEAPRYPRGSEDHFRQTLSLQGLVKVCRGSRSLGLLRT